MTYTAAVDTTRGFAPAPARPAPAKRRRNLWRRAFARLLVARRRAAEREIAEFARLSGLELPPSARRLRRIVHTVAAR
jgi:hypothetical protein